MPGLPSTVSETESPTGCTKQLISVTSRIPDPAAELIRPPGMNPSSSAFRNTGSQRRRIRLDRRQRPRDPLPHRPRRVRPVEVALGPLGVLLPQHVEAYLLPGQVGERGP